MLGRAGKKPIKVRNRKTAVGVGVKIGMIPVAQQIDDHRRRKKQKNGRVFLIQKNILIKKFNIWVNCISELIDTNYTDYLNSSRFLITLVLVQKSGHPNWSC